MFIVEVTRAELHFTSHTRFLECPLLKICYGELLQSSAMRISTEIEWNLKAHAMRFILKTNWMIFQDLFYKHDQPPPSPGKGGSRRFDPIISLTRGENTRERMNRKEYRNEFRNSVSWLFLGWIWRPWCPEIVCRSFRGPNGDQNRQKQEKWEYRKNEFPQ